MLPPQKKSLLVIEDDALVHRLFERSFAETYDFHFAVSGEEALDAVVQREFPVVTLDLKLPDASGLEILPVLRRLNRFQKIIILTGCASQESAISAINHGAFKYLQKPFVPTEIQEVLEEAFVRYSQECAAGAGKSSNLSDLLGLGLSQRESEISYWVVQGETNLEIANRLAVSPRTVEKYMENIFAKLKINSRLKSAPNVRDLRVHIE